MAAAGASDWYAEARRRATVSRRRSAGKQCSTRWPDLAPPVALSDGPLGEVQAADREIARQTALRARKVAEFAASRPASADRAQGEPGAMSPERWAARPDILRDVSEWAAQELVVALSITGEAADALLERSMTLVHRLPGTLAALEAGALHVGHLWPMLDKVAPIQDDTVRAEVEAELLRWAAGRVTTPAQLGAKARREVLRRDARAAARRLEKAIKERSVHLRSGAVDGMAAVTALLTAPEAVVFCRALGEYADAVPDDPESPPRSRAQKMADCLMDLVLRRGETDMPPVQILLHVVASVGTLAGGDEPGEIDGHVVPAELVRELVRALGPQSAAAPETRPAKEGPAPTQPPPADPGGRRSSTGVSVPEPSPEHAEAAGTSSVAQPRWEEREQRELEQWWAEMERRVLAGESDAGQDPEQDAGPGPGPDAGQDPGSPEWLESDPGLPDIDDDPHDEEVLAWQLAHPLACEQDGDGPAVAYRPAGQPARDSTPAGWWATADSAVDDAGTAVLSAQRAVARAHRLVRTARIADDADEAEWQAGPGGRATAAEDALAALAAASADQRNQLADLLAATAGGGLADRPRIALSDAVTGALLALTDFPTMRRVAACGAPACRREPGLCEHDLAGQPGLGPPGPTDGYRPSAPLDRFVRARDRRCRQPGCRRRVPRGGELDHDRPYPSGPTTAENLVGYCTAHHRGKHQAPGWRHELAPDGSLRVTTPTGLTAVTTPPPY